MHILPLFSSASISCVLIVSQLAISTMISQLSHKLTELYGADPLQKKIALQFHDCLVIGEATREKVLFDVSKNLQVIIDTIHLAEKKSTDGDYITKLKNAQFDEKESMQFFPIREGAGDDETGHWKLPINVEENGQVMNRNLLCVTWPANAYVYCFIV